MRSICLWIIYLLTAQLLQYRLVQGEQVDVAKPDQKTTTTATTADSSSTTTTSSSDVESDEEELIKRKYRSSRDASIKASAVKKSSASLSTTAAEKMAATTTNLEDEKRLDVVQLNSRNFGKHISDGSIWLIEFYSPHCSHCVEFASSYADIARHYHSQSATAGRTSTTGTNKNSMDKKKKQRNIKVGKVNGEIERALVSRFAINSYPCFFLIDRYSVYKFDEVRLKKNLMTFAEGGYKKYTPISLYLSPMGPLGIFQGTLMSTGHIFFDIFYWLQNTFGLSPLIVGMILFGTMFLGCFFLIVSLALIIPEKPKQKRD